MNREEAIDAFTKKKMVKAEGAISTIRVLDDKDGQVRLSAGGFGWISWDSLELAEEWEADQVRAHHEQLHTLTGDLVSALPPIALTAAANERLESNSSQDGLRLVGIFPGDSILAVRVSEDGKLTGYSSCLHIDDIELIKS